MGLPQNLYEDLAGIQSLAASVMEQVRARLYVELRFLDRALFGLQPTPVLTFPTLGSDGTHLFYNPAYVIGRWTDGKNELCRDILHTALHFVFRHPFVGSNTNLILWDIAVDVAVEAAITDLSMPCLTSMFEPGEAGFLSLLREHVPQLTAERIYAFLKEGGVQPPLLGEMAAAFRRDSHEHWYTSQQTSFDNDPLRPSQWEQIRRRAQQELSLQQKAYGNKSRGLLLNMREATREKVDYRTFLQKFTHRAEVLHLSDEEFDPILYTYGLNTYGCLPLIEPLEFRDEKTAFFVLHCAGYVGLVQRIAFHAIFAAYLSAAFAKWHAIPPVPPAYFAVRCGHNGGHRDPHSRRVAAKTGFHPPARRRRHGFPPSLYLYKRANEE